MSNDVVIDEKWYDKEPWPARVVDFDYSMSLKAAIRIAAKAPVA